MAETKSVNEEKTTAASYILTFYQETEELSHHRALYLNLLLEIEQKYDERTEEGKKLSEEDINKLKETINNLRYYITKAYDRYRAMVENKKLKEDKKIETTYKKIESSYLITREQVKNINIAFQNILTQKIMKSLLETSQELIDNVYKND